MKTTIKDLREHLFATLEALRDEDKPMDIARAKAIAGVSQVIINSAKAETDLINATGAKPTSGFFEALPEPTRPALVRR